MKVTNNINTLKHFLKNHVNAIKSKSKHKNNVKSCLKTYEQCIQDNVLLVEEWKCNPFNPNIQNLWTLRTGGHPLEELGNDFESAYKDDHALVQDSINTQ